MLNFTIVIPYYDGHDTIGRLVESVPNDIPIVIVDDHSKRPLQSIDHANTTILKASRKGYFAGAVNTGISNTRGDVLILNQDIYFTGDGWLKQLSAALEEGYSYIGERIKGTRRDWPNGYIHGTYMYLTRELINKTGLLNQLDFPMWGCTAEYQLRAAREGFKILPLETVDDFVHTRAEGEQFGESFRTLVNDEQDKRSLFVSTPPLVSVIIPVHGEKYAKFLPSTVNSLIGGPTDLGDWSQQTFGAFEVVIVDDSSPDSTPEIIADVVDPWKGVRSIRLDRPWDEVWNDTVDKYIGKVVALNAGISAAYGKQIIVLDCDDMMEEDRLERMYRASQAFPHSIIYDDMMTFTNGERTKRWNVGRGDYDFETTLRMNQVHNSIMFPKSGWTEIGGYPTRFKYGREDWAVNVKFGINGYCGVKLDDYAGLLYRRDGQNRTLMNTAQKWMQYFQGQMYQEFRHIYEGERPMGCCGRGANTSNTRNQAFAPGTNQVIAMDGTSTLEYIGGRSSGASFSVWGFATQTQYRVTPGRTFLADNQDLVDSSRQNRGLLQMVEGGSPMFRLLEEPEPEVAMETVAHEDPAVVVMAPEVTTVGLESDVDTTMLDGNLSLLRGEFPDHNYNDDQIEILIAYERANQNRVGAIRYLEDALNDN